ncbi:SDR family oxidoreductase [Bradyrhizobium sp. CCBAU 53421]|uniref:SDR family oxidoreductase n=1 Tax=Bradyrhizobium sp. CCBAU 53421 TaxID=1325120 RepID=UPI001FEF39CF|nr:SDR family oxidoreductase [Bradyrhizobium sp. CCBAU 53421]
MSPETTEKVKTALLNGATVSQIISGKPVGGGMRDPSLRIADAQRLAASRRLDPELNRFIAEATANNNGRGQQLRFAKARARIQSAIRREEANDGVAYVTPLRMADEAQYDRLMDTNVKSVFFSVQAVEPIMREGGSIIVTTAWLNQVGVPGRAVLSASKAAVRSFARTMSAELIHRRIRVNAISPGLIDIPILRGVGQSEHPGQTDAQFRDYLAGASATIPIGRLGRADEIAAAVLFLASDASSYMLARNWSSMAAPPSSNVANEVCFENVSFWLISDLGRRPRSRSS